MHTCWGLALIWQLSAGGGGCIGNKVLLSGGCSFIFASLLATLSRIPEMPSFLHSRARVGVSKKKNTLQNSGAYLKGRLFLYNRFQNLFNSPVSYVIS